jgi:hypothetical protein
MQCCEQIAIQFCVQFPAQGSLQLNVQTIFPDMC